jgi:DNA primase
MQFPQDFPDKLRSSILVSEVVGKKVVLKKKGREFMGLCPFHNEKTPSFTVNDQKGFYHCFGCQAHGDIITFEMTQEGLDFKEAIYKLARDFSIEVPQVKNFKIDQVNNDHLAYEILEEITKFFEKNLYLPIAQDARKYLQKRGINSVIAKKFRLGFALDSYESLTKHLQSKNYLEKDILQCGIIAKNDRQKIYDKLRNRITFPITNKKNQVIAFGARTLGNDLPKYLNSQETEIFKKNLTLYNIANARKAIFDKSFGVIVEGYMDAISLSVNGIENVVAGLGTAIGENHLKQLFQITDKIIICLDGDSAGIRAARRLSDIALPLINVKKNIALAILPNELDPDDFIKTYGAQAFTKFLDEAKSLSQSLFDFAISDLSLNDVNQIVAEDRIKLEEILHQKTNLIIDNQCKKHFTNFFKDCVFNLTRNNFKKNIR